MTGASSGIGAELARVFAAHGHALALVARRRDRLEALADEIAADGKARPLVIVADLGRPDALKTIRGSLSAAGVEPQYVVNNAGYAVGGVAEQLGIIDVNMTALTALSLMFVDSLERHRGGILNVGSMAGFVPGPGLAVYYASKAYVRSLTDALRQELGPRGIRVVLLAPGPVPTEFGERAGTRSRRVPKILVQSAGRVAAEGYRGLMTGKRVIVPGAVNRLAIALIRFVPTRLVLAAVGSRQARRQQPQGQ